MRRDSRRNVNVYWGLQQYFGNLDVSAYPHLTLTVRKGKFTSGETQLLVRVFSGNQNVFETSGAVFSKKTQRIRIDLSQWSGKNHITGIEILVKRESGNWKGKAGAVIEKIGFN